MLRASLLTALAAGMAAAQNITTLKTVFSSVDLNVEFPAVSLVGFQQYLEQVGASEKFGDRINTHNHIIRIAAGDLANSFTGAKSDLSKILLLCYYGCDSQVDAFNLPSSDIRDFLNGFTEPTAEQYTTGYVNARMDDFF
nr:CP52k-like protein 8 [Membranobalanus longirostrum]